MAIYASERLYILDATELEERICRIDNIIVAMEEAMLTAAAGQDTEEYRLDDGQTKINVTTRGMDEMVKSVTNLTKLKNYYVNKYNGHSVKLVDHQANRLITGI